MEETAGGFSDNKVHFAELLTDYLNTVNLTRRLLEEVPNAVLPRVGWDQVVGMGQNFFAEVTRVGELWTGAVSDVPTLDDNMQEFFGLLQRVIILAHGATRDTGSTLGAHIRITVDQFVNVSFNLIKEAVFSYEDRRADVIPQMIVSVWESFDALKKIPPNNATAVGKAIGQVAFSVKYNLRILKGLNEASSDDPPNEVEDKAPGDIGSDAKEVERGSCDPPEKVEDRASVSEGSDVKEVEKGSCDPPENVEDRASGAEEIETEDQQKKGSCDPPEKVEGISSGAAEIDTKDQQKKGSSDPPEKVEDSSSVAAEIDTKDQQKKGSCDPPENFEDKPSGAAEIDTKDLKKCSSDPPNEVKDKASDAAEIGSKTLSLNCSCVSKLKLFFVECCDLLFLHDEVEDKASDDIGSNAKEVEKGSCDPPEKLDDMASGAEGNDTKEVEKGSCDTHETFKDRASDAAEIDTIIDQQKNSSSDPPEEMDIARLTIDAVTAIHDMLIHLSPIAIGLHYKENKGTIPDFVDRLEKILELCKVIESQTEALVRPDQALSSTRSVAPINIYAAMRNIAAIFHGVGGSQLRSSEFDEAWNRSIRLIRQLGAEFRKRSGSDDHLVSHAKSHGLMSFW